MMTVSSSLHPRIKLKFVAVIKIINKNKLSQICPREKGWIKCFTSFHRDADVVRLLKMGARSGVWSAQVETSGLKIWNLCWGAEKLQFFEISLEAGCTNTINNTHTHTHQFILTAKTNLQPGSKSACVWMAQHTVRGWFFLYKLIFKDLKLRFSSHLYIKQSVFLPAFAPHEDCFPWLQWSLRKHDWPILLRLTVYYKKTRTRLSFTQGWDIILKIKD